MGITNRKKTSAQGTPSIIQMRSRIKGALNSGLRFPSPLERQTNARPKKKSTATAAPKVVCTASRKILVEAANPDGVLDRGAMSLDPFRGARWGSCLTDYSKDKCPNVGSLPTKIKTAGVE